MQFESHATPFAGTPQQRYATLHRAIESGLDSDDVWRELASVSLELGHRGEAVRCTRRIRNETDRRAMEYRLQRLGVLPAARHRDDGAAGPPVRGDRAAAESALPAPSLGDHLLDAAQYLLHQQMPWFVLTTTLAFPLIVGVGGFLTAGGSLLLLAAIAALPGLSVLAVVAAMGRQVLLRSSAGESDVPNLPEFGRLLGEARRFAVDALLVLGMFASPAVAAALLGQPAAAVALGLLGALLAPIAFALRQVRGDLRALSPCTLVRAASRGGREYPVLAAVTVALFAPAVGVEWFAFDRPVWVQVAIVGPLCVLPVFAASRLLGSWLDARRDALGELLRIPTPQAAAPAPARVPAVPATTAAPVPAAPTASSPRTKAKRRVPPRPAALDGFRAPNVRRIGKQDEASQPAPSAPPLGERPATREIEGRRPHPRPAGAPPQVGAGPRPRRAQARPEQPQSAQHAQPARGGPSLTDRPDLASMPGAVVVSGQERVRHGAAARRP